MGAAMGRCGSLVACLVAAALMAPPARAAPAESQLLFTALGTNSGPIPNAQRSEPASLVRYGDQYILVDVGDGAIEQLAKVGVNMGEVQTVLISHMHFDHTGGLFALISTRYQARYTGLLTIYGPPGVKGLVEGLLIAAQSGVLAAGAIRGPSGPTDWKVRVVELAEGSNVSVGAVAITAATNSHYATLAPTAPDVPRPISLSYRFDAPDRSILYTGDTGPSQNVERLGQGVDLLVSEIMDPVVALARIKATRPDVPDFALKVVGDHFRREHLAPEEVGLLAQRTGAKALVLTHNALPDEAIPSARKAIAGHFKGKITFAADLQTF